MNYDRFRFPFTLAILILLLFGLPTSGDIVLKGTVAEQAELQALIDSLSSKSATAASHYAALEARSEKVRISFDKTKLGGEATYADRRVKLDKEILNCIKFVKSAGGDDGARDALTLELVLAHEALGHQLRNLQNMDSSENAAMALVNTIRQEIGVAQREAYLIKNGPVWVSRFSDGSFADFTPGRRKAAKRKPGTSPNSNTSGLLPTTGTIQLVGTMGAGGSILIGLDPAAGIQTLTVDGSEYGSGVQTVDLTQLDLTLDSFTGTNAPNMLIDDFDMTFGDILLNDGILTGINTASMFEPGTHGAGDWDYLGGSGDFTFDLGADLLLTNSLFQLEGDDGVATNTLAGSMQFDVGSGQWYGTATLDSGLFVRAIPEPGHAIAIWFAAILLGNFLRRRSNFSPNSSPIRPGNPSSDSPELLSVDCTRV